MVTTLGIAKFVRRRLLEVLVMRRLIEYENSEDRRHAQNQNLVPWWALAMWCIADKQIGCEVLRRNPRPKELGH